MVERHANKGPMGSGGNRSKGSSRVLRLVEQERRKERCGHDGHETQDDSHATSSQGESTVSYMPEGSYHGDRDHEPESPRRQIRELELKTRHKCRRRTPKGLSHDHNSMGSLTEGSYHHNHSQQSRERSSKSRDRYSESPRREREGRQNATMDAMS